MRVNISYGRKDGKRLMKLSVIIVSYENCEILRDCLDSIKKFNDLKDEAEIIISDNSITNSVYEMVKKDYPEIQIIQQRPNRSWIVLCFRLLVSLRSSTAL